MNLDFITAELFFAQAAVSSSGNSGVRSRRAVLNYSAGSVAEGTGKIGTAEYHRLPKKQKSILPTVEKARKNVH